MNMIFGREAEEPCRLAFSNWLRGRGCNQNESDWHSVPIRDQPPDYFLVLGKRQFPAEITTLMDAFGSNLKGRTYIPVHKDADGFRALIESKLKLMAPLDRFWIASLNDIPKTNWKEASGFILSTIRACPKGNAPSYATSRYGTLISFAHEAPGLEFTFGASTWPDAEAPDILKRSLQDKGKTLTKHGVAKPWILLCWVSSLLVQKHNYQNSFNPREGQLYPYQQEVMDLAREFEAVFLVDESGVAPLVGKERFWETNRQAAGQ